MVVDCQGGFWFLATYHSYWWSPTLQQTSSSTAWCQACLEKFSAATSFSTATNSSWKLGVFFNAMAQTPIAVSKLQSECWIKQERQQLQWYWHPGETTIALNWPYQRPHQSLVLQNFQTKLRGKYKGSVTLKCVVPSDVIWNKFHASHWLTGKKEGKSFNGRHETYFIWHLMVSHNVTKP